MRRTISLSVAIALLASVLTAQVVVGHHVDHLDVAVACDDRGGGDAIVTVGHNIFGRHKLEWKLLVDGRQAAGAKQIPDSRYSSSLRITGAVPYGVGSVKVVARATYPDGRAESRWREARADYDCPRPPRIYRVNLVSKHMLCGDPRGWNRLINSGNVPLLTSWSFIDGDKRKPWQRITVERLVRAGQVRTLGARWMRGKVIVKVKHPVTGSWKNLYSFRVGKDVKPRRWGRGGCPSNRYGTPGFGRPMARGQWKVTVKHPYVDSRR